MKTHIICSLLMTFLLTSCMGKMETLEVSNDNIVFDEVTSEVTIDSPHNFYLMDYIEYEGEEVAVRINGPIEKNVEGKHFSIVTINDNTITIKALQNDSGKECYGSVSLRGTEHMEGATIKFRQK